MPLPFIARYSLSGGTQPIKLSIKIGFGQPGRTRVSLDGLPVSPATKTTNADGTPPAGREGNFTLSLGQSDNLVGKKLSVISVIWRPQEEEDRTDRIITLTGGASELTDHKAEKIAKRGGWLSYIAIIEFVR